jgi:hypothetical protein
MPTTEQHEMVSSQSDIAPDDATTVDQPTFKSPGTSCPIYVSRFMSTQSLLECRKLIYKLRASFFFFGLINNVLYVIILSAALDLVPPNTPKGIIAFCNIFPALVAKLTWPYLLRGTIRYARRLVGCCLMSILGMIVSSLRDNEV